MHKRMKNIIKGRDDAKDPASQVRIYDLAREKSFTWPRFSASSRCNAVLPNKVLGEGAFGTVCSFLVPSFAGESHPTRCCIAQCWRPTCTPHNGASAIRDGYNTASHKCSMRIVRSDGDAMV